MFEVREVNTNKAVLTKSAMGSAMDAADAHYLRTGKHYCVVKVEAVYHTAGSVYTLRPAAQVLSRAGDTLLDGWKRFRSLRDKLVGSNEA